MAVEDAVHGSQVGVWPGSSQLFSKLATALAALACKYGTYISQSCSLSLGALSLQQLLWRHRRSGSGLPACVMTVSAACSKCCVWLRPGGESARPGTVVLRCTALHLQAHHWHPVQANVSEPCGQHQGMEGTLAGLRAAQVLHMAAIPASDVHNSTVSWLCERACSIQRSSRRGEQETLTQACGHGTGSHVPAVEH